MKDPAQTSAVLLPLETGGSVLGTWLWCFLGYLWNWERRCLFTEPRGNETSTMSVSICSERNAGIPTYSNLTPSQNRAVETERRPTQVCTSGGAQPERKAPGASLHAQFQNRKEKLSLYIRTEHVCVKRSKPDQMGQSTGLRARTQALCAEEPGRTVDWAKLWEQ